MPKPALLHFGRKTSTDDRAAYGLAAIVEMDCECFYNRGAGLSSGFFNAHPNPLIPEGAAEVPRDFIDARGFIDITNSS